MKYFGISFLDKFHCSKGVCPKTCCKGWQILVDAKTMEKIEQEPADRRKTLLRNIKGQKTDSPQIRKRLGACPYHTGEGLCGLQQEGRTDLMPRVCREYPRRTISYEAFAEIALELACPEVARLFLEEKEPLSMLPWQKEEREILWKIGNEDLPFLEFLQDLRQTMVDEAQTQERVMMLPVSELHDFPGHPFQVRDDEEMEKLAESITQHGVLIPGLVRPRAAGGYEIVAGHRRKFASMKAGIREMPVIVRDMDDDTAVILMVDSNVQRENVLPSEKARAYKMKLDAIKRKAGRPSKENSAQVGQNFSVEKVAEDAGESKSQIQRYIRLNDLIPELLEMVDGNEIKFNPAYELAFLRPEEQAVLYDILQAEEVTPSLSQAQRLKRASQEGQLSEQEIAAIMREEKAQTRDTGKVTLPAKEIEQFFPKSYTPEQKKKVIVKLLASWARQRGEQVR